MKRLTINDIQIPKPDFKSVKLPKGEIITKWLIELVENMLETGIADFGDFIPTKEEFAVYLGVSTATVQNSIREVKNLGYFSSKQSKGTVIVDYYSKDLNNENLEKNYTSPECKIKKMILEGNIKINSPIFSIPEFSNKLYISQNTVRFALNSMAKNGFLEKKHLKGNKYIWIYKKEFVLTKEELMYGLDDSNCTLIKRVGIKIEKYLKKTYKHGEKILPNSAFAAMFNVSIKTINDIMKKLNSKKIILSRRGKYGTIYLGEAGQSKRDFLSDERKKFNDINKYTYSWQKTLNLLKKYITENYKPGDKILSIREFANILNVSPNTIRRALKDMQETGFILTKRGKFGGIFVTEIPDTNQAYRWLALNPDVVDFNNQNNL